MIRAVLDTNVVVSAAIKRDGKPDRIVRQATVGFEWLTSEFILNEVSDVLARTHIQQKYREQVTDSNRARFLAAVREVAEIVEVESSVDVVKEDAKDNAILACAKDGRADYIVTGDRHLLTLGAFDGIQIVTPQQFLQILERTEPEK